MGTQQLCKRAVYAVARQLGRSGRLDQETYDAAHRFVGDAGMAELVSLCGHYTLISSVLNAFAVPLLPGAAPMGRERDAGGRSRRLRARARPADAAASAPVGGTGSSYG